MWVIAQQRTATEHIRYAPGVHLLKVHHKMHMGHLTGIADQCFLHLCQIKAQSLDLPMIQIDAIGHNAIDDRTVDSWAKLLLQVSIQFGSQGFIKDLPRTTCQLMVDHKLEVMGTTVIGGQEQQIITLAHLIVKRLQQSCQILIELEVSLIGMFATGTIFMSDNISL